jgi:hypothetical protein
MDGADRQYNVVPQVRCWRFSFDGEVYRYLADDNIVSGNDESCP